VAYNLGCTNPRHQVTMATNFAWWHVLVDSQKGTCFMSPYWCLIILLCLLDSWKICATVPKTPDTHKHMALDIQYDVKMLANP